MDLLWSWKELAVMALLLVVWTLVIQRFPEILTKGVLKHIDHEYGKRLERFKSEIQAAYSSINKAVDFASNQTELRSRSVIAAEKLWKNIVELDESSPIVILDSLLFQSEVEKQMREKSHPVISDVLSEFEDDEFLIKYADKSKQLDDKAERLFTSFRLWDIYGAIVSLHGRFQFLIHSSITEKKYLSWKDDELFESNLKGVLDDEVIENARKRERGGLQAILLHLQTEFLSEAVRVMSGSSYLESTVPSVQGVVERELSRLAQDIDVRRASGDSPLVQT